MEDLRPEDLSGIYKEIASAMGVEVAIEIHGFLKGQQITFPIQLYSKEYRHAVIKEKYYNGECSVRELSQMFGYSDRRIRQILNEPD